MCADLIMSHTAFQGSWSFMSVILTVVGSAEKWKQATQRTIESITYLSIYSHKLRHVFWFYDN